MIFKLYYFYYLYHGMEIEVKPLVLIRVSNHFY